MKHAVAVCANRPKVFDGVNKVFLADVGNRSQVMNLDVVCAECPVDLFKAETANATCITVVLDARLARMRASVVRF